MGRVESADERSERSRRGAKAADVVRRVTGAGLYTKSAERKERLLNAMEVVTELLDRIEMRAGRLGVRVVKIEVHAHEQRDLEAARATVREIASEMEELAVHAQRVAAGR